MRINRPEKNLRLTLARQLESNTLFSRLQGILSFDLNYQVFSPLLASTCLYATGSGFLNSSFHPAIHCSYLSTFQPKVWWPWSLTVCLGSFQKLAFFHRSLRASLPKPDFYSFPWIVTREKHTKWHTNSTKFACPNHKNQNKTGGLGVNHDQVAGPVSAEARAPLV